MTGVYPCGQAGSSVHDKDIKCAYSVNQGIHCVNQGIYNVRPADCTTNDTTDIDPMLVQCWSIVYDAGPTSNHHGLQVSGWEAACPPPPLSPTLVSRVAYHKPSNYRLLFNVATFMMEYFLLLPSADQCNHFTPALPYPMPLIPVNAELFPHPRQIKLSWVYHVCWSLSFSQNMPCDGEA